MNRLRMATVTEYSTAAGMALGPNLRNTMGRPRCPTFPKEEFRRRAAPSSLGSFSVKGIVTKKQVELAMAARTTEPDFAPISLGVSPPTYMKAISGSMTQTDSTLSMLKKRSAGRNFCISQPNPIGTRDDRTTSTEFISGVSV